MRVSSLRFAKSQKPITINFQLPRKAAQMYLRGKRTAKRSAIYIGDQYSEWANVRMFSPFTLGMMVTGSVIGGIGLGLYGSNNAQNKSYLECSKDKVHCYQSDNHRECRLKYTNQYILTGTLLGVVAGGFWPVSTILGVVGLSLYLPYRISKSVIKRVV